jgi:hypothetical protein
MSKKILYISDGFSIDEYALDSDNSDLEVEENVDFILDASELANPNFVSIDSFYHKRIGELEFDDYGLILIPTSLSEDVYISFSGIRLGVHLRLDAMSRYIPILFIGPDSFTELCKFSDYAGFLSSPGIYTLSEGKNQVKDIASLAKYILNNSHPLTGDDYLLSLDKFNLKASGFLDSRHSRANEYGLLKLDIESGHNVFASNKKSLKIVSDLYTKWLMAKSGLELPTESGIAQANQGFTIPSEGKRVLIIEDEWKKGWLELYKKIFPGATVEHLPIQKGNKWEEDIKPMLEEKLQQEWDLFLVDMRLTDEDFNNNKYESISGLKALDLIKQENQGFQVCITSASNNHKVYDYGIKKIGADEVFIKPSIEDDSKTALSQLKNVSNRCFERGYLKSIFSTTAEIKDKILSTMNHYFVDPENPSWLTQDLSLEYSKNLSNNIIEQISLLETLIQLNSFNEHDLFKQPLIILHQIFENFVQSPLNYQKEEKVKTRVPKLYLKSREVKAVTKHPVLNGTLCIPFKFKFDHYSFQDKRSKKSRLSLKFEEVPSKIDEYNSNYYFELYLLFKRHNFLEKELDNYILLRNLRNQYCGHNTNTYNHLERPLNSQDILDYMNILKRVLLPK